MKSDYGQLAVYLETELGRGMDPGEQSTAAGMHAKGEHPVAILNTIRHHP